MKTLVLTASDLRALTDTFGFDALMDALIARLDEAFRTYDAADWDIPVRSGFSYQTPAPGLLEWMPTRAPDGVASVKMVGYHPQNPAVEALPTILSTIVQFDGRTGHLLAMADGTFLTALRTGAASAIASRHLASPRSRRLGVIGSGAQAVTQLHALSRVFDLEEVLVHDRRPEVAQTFRSRVAGLGISGLQVRVAPAAEIVETSDILCTCTSSEVGSGAVFEDAKTQPWLHVNAVGSDFPGKIELPKSLLQRACVVPDFRGQALAEGECQQLSVDELGPDLADVVREDVADSVREGLTVFDSTGWALEDHVALSLVVEHARRMDLGSELNIEPVLADPLNPYSFPSAGVPLEALRAAFPRGSSE